MEVINNPPKEKWTEILSRPLFETEDIEKRVAPILTDVKNNGDKALLSFTKKFDNVSLETFAVSKQEIEQAEESIDIPLKNAINVAKQNVHKFHSAQKEEINYVETVPGVECWRKSVAIEKVGLYVPGGTAPLFSSVLMLAIPAKIAGCSEIVLCSPPREDGTLHPAILYAANVSGVKKIFKVGGAQAIAAMAYGTETIPAVNKIYGPGNQYVTAAKQMVNQAGMAIDMPAGPSEVLILTDKSAEPEFIASDLLSQAEHGADSQVILVTLDPALVPKVEAEVEKQLQKLPRKDLAQKSLENSKIIIMQDQRAAIEIINEYAPEHLILSVSNEGYFTDKIKNAGSVFLGNFTPESAGDYASGTNHTLPTNGFAKSYSGVSLDSFVKKITFQRISHTGLLQLGRSIEVMAEAEDLFAHKNAVTVRMNKIIQQRQNDDDDD